MVLVFFQSSWLNPQKNKQSFYDYVSFSWVKAKWTELEHLPISAHDGMLSKDFPIVCHLESKVTWYFLPSLGAVQKVFLL